MRKNLVLLLVIPVLACAGGRTGPQEADSGPTCPTGAVAFVLQQPSTDASHWCVGSGCSLEWLTIVDPAGVEHRLDWPCVPDCETCAPVACPLSCAVPQPFPGAGLLRAWDGRYFESGTCGAGSLCASKTCASAGRYVAKMCVHRDRSSGAGKTFCDADMASTCTQVAFDWPPAAGTATVIGQTGACCPKDWLMYDCKYPDGRAGFNCHNPAMGCASSDTCGNGCDTAVSGRCGATTT
jgi:hypothetical protein